jgi:two-component system chemotaxis response regulator CheB
VDTLFRSVAHGLPGKGLGVVLTGMGSDGTVGCRLLKRQGSTIFAQDEASCVVFGMPKEVIRAGVVDLVVPLDRMAEEIARAVRGMP